MSKVGNIQSPLSGDVTSGWAASNTAFIASPKSTSISAGSSPKSERSAMDLFKVKEKLEAAVREN
jgi:hypothetical protein